MRHRPPTFIVPGRTLHIATSGPRNPGQGLRDGPSRAMPTQKKTMLAQCNNNERKAKQSENKNTELSFRIIQNHTLVYHLHPHGEQLRLEAEKEWISV